MKKSKSIITTPTELTNLIAASLNMDFSEKQTKLIRHLILTEFDKYEDVLSDVADELAPYQDDFAIINNLVNKINKALVCTPKKEVL